jgi:hypothetical protein
MEMPTTTMTTDLESTNYLGRHLPYVVPSNIDDELEWFFQHGEKHARGGMPWDPHGRWSTVACRVIANWLSGIDRYDAEILKLAYAREPRPKNLQRRLRRLTTVVVRLAALEAQWPTDPAEQKAHERRTANRLAWQYTLHGPRVVRPYLTPAAGLLRAAVRAYSKQRGNGPSMTFRISTLPEFRQKSPGST